MFPYIGITDFETGEQARQMLDYFGQLSPPANRRLMIGVMMSYRTLKGLKTPWSQVWPPKEKLAEIFIKHPLAYNTLHYADYDGPTTGEDLLEAISFCGANLHAVQFDMIWPDPRMLDAIRQSQPRLDLILQVGRGAFNYVIGESEILFADLKHYRDIIDCVLLDCSMGKGRELDSDLFKGYLKLLRRDRPDLAVAAAGGLGPKTLPLVEPLVYVYPDISIDAQGQLRKSGSNRDPIDWDLAREYLSQAVKLFKVWQIPD